MIGKSHEVANGSKGLHYEDGVLTCDIERRRLEECVCSWANLSSGAGNRRSSIHKDGGCGGNTVKFRPSAEGNRILNSGLGRKDCGRSAFDNVQILQ